ncbi:MAG TPA: hypothetical protein VG099_12245 [Gemmataceae bacterium]|jgi:hypothetical protein|nr:hypothetical protein [Gemmataceae bacterium]
MRKFLKPRLIMALAYVFAAALGFCVLAFQQGEQRCDESRFQQIKPGMTLAEVETILGPPMIQLEEPEELKLWAATVKDRACWEAGIWWSPDRQTTLHLYLNQDGKVSRALISSPRE